VGGQFGCVGEEAGRVVLLQLDPELAVERGEGDLLGVLVGEGFDLVGLLAQLPGEDDGLADAGPAVVGELRVAGDAQRDLIGLDVGDDLGEAEGGDALLGDVSGGDLNPADRRGRAGLGRRRR
jgi:hypothetical protein